MNMMNVTSMRTIHAGFTLVEAIVVIVITSILAVSVALFIRKPVDSYIDLERRAELADITDTAVRRLSRDLHLAVPNSVRTVASDNACIESIPTTNGGRYRADVDAVGGGNVFATTTALTRLDVLGPLSAAPAAGDLLVIYNLGIPGADAYNRDNVATIAAGSSASTLNFGAKQFPFASPSQRFQIVSGTEQAVFYACKGVGVDAAGNGTGTLYRLSAYGLNASAPASCPATPANTPILAQYVSTCQFSYAPGANARDGLVSVRLGITKGNETTQIYQDIHVNNAP